MVAPDSSLPPRGRRVLSRPPWASVEAFPWIEQRSITEIANAMTSEVLPDGRVQLSLPGTKTLPAHQSRKVWRHKDVSLMRNLMVGFYESPYGLLNAFDILHRAEFDEIGLKTEDLAPLYTVELHRAWSAPELMLMSADDPFVDMMEAAALSAPTGPLGRDELLADSGVIFFQKERIIPMMSHTHPVRGVMWYLGAGVINMKVLIDGHHKREAPSEDQFDLPGETYAYLYVLNLLRTPVVQPNMAGEGAVEALGFLRSIAAIARSSQTRSENKVVEHREKKSGRVRNIKKETIRILSLRNPDYGRYELDGATGRKLRRHWVRGHWRNQWYRGEQVNKRIWIDGFIRGDAALGTVTGEKVYVARAQKQESIEQGVAS